MKRVKIAIVGLRFGRNLLYSEILQGPGAEWIELAAVCDRDPSRLDPVAEKCGVRATREPARA